MAAPVYVDPYSGLAASVITSNVLDCRDAFDISVTVHITSGTSSDFTYQVSNLSVKPQAGVAAHELAWSNWTRYVAPSGNSSSASCLEVPLAYNWARILRTTSGASMQINWVKQIRERGRI